MPDEPKGAQGGPFDFTQQYYGDASLDPRIFGANTGVLKDPDKTRVGQKLRIP